MFKRPKLDSASNKENLAIADRKEKGKGRARGYSPAGERTSIRTLSNLTSASRLTQARFSSTEHTFTFDYSYIARVRYSIDSQREHMIIFNQSADRELMLDLARNTALRSKVLQWISDASDDGEHYDMQTLADIECVCSCMFSLPDHKMYIARSSGIEYRLWMH